MAVKYVETPARAAAGARNLQHARAVAASRPRTTAQLAAARTNIAAAHTAARGHRRTESPAQAAAARHALAIGRSHARHHSAKQIEADKRNLEKARLARWHKQHAVKQQTTDTMASLGWHPAGGSVGTQALALLRAGR